MSTVMLDFIVGLEKDFPSTVSTIARTCGKLAPKDEQGENCALCERYVIFLRFSFVRKLINPLRSKARPTNRPGLEGPNIYQVNYR